MLDTYLRLNSGVHGTGTLVHTTLPSLCHFNRFCFPQSRIASLRKALAASFDQSRMVTLINEIWDIILDYLHDDKKSLSKCGLVTRGWLPTCRYHLFFELVLRLHDKTVDIKAIFRSAQDCGILPYVQKLAIRSGGRGLWSEEPIPHLPFFPCVREMTISHLDWTYILPKSEKWIVAQMANVAVFRIVECEVRELNRVSRVISTIPVLPHLCIQGGRWSSDKESQLEAVSTQFHELVLSGLSPKSYNTIYDWIYPFCEKFEVFKIFEDANSIIHVSPLLRTMATYLLHLTLQLPYAGNSDIQGTLLPTDCH